MKILITLLVTLFLMPSCAKKLNLNKSNIEKHQTGMLDFTKLIPDKIPYSAVFRQEGFWLWDPCVIRTDDGTFHLLYSRWKKELGFDAWATHAEIAWATSKSAEGPYEFRSVVLPARGSEYWDGNSVYNTCIIQYDDKFYLYYTGNHGSESWQPERIIKISSEEWWDQRNRQRIGVAIADHPGGPWKRSDKPLIDVGENFGQGIINVPNVLVLPRGDVRMYYKTMAPGPGRFGGGVFHYGASASGPLGPFVRHPNPLVDKRKILQTNNHFDFHIDDHFEWYQDGKYYAIVKDHDAPFMTPYGRSLILFESHDGYDWYPSPNTLVKDFSITWEDDTKQDFKRLEMPKLLIEKGKPRILSLAALPDSEEESFLVMIPLK
jgi:hypothetical protein